MEKITVSITEEQSIDIKAISEQTKLSTSELISNAIKDYIDRFKRKLEDERPIEEEIEVFNQMAQEPAYTQDISKEYAKEKKKAVKVER